MPVFDAEPYRLAWEPETTALLMIDMQRDFMEPGGFGEFLGNDVSPMRAAVEPARRVLESARKAGLFIVHTREGHRTDLSDLSRSKYERGNLKVKIGDKGPMGRVLVRGEKGHDIIPEVHPIEGEPIVDKQGKGAFWATDLLSMLEYRGIKTLVVCGVTLEVCVHTTVREASDRGFDALVVKDATASYFPEFYRVGIEMISAQGGIFGWVADSAEVCKRIDAVAEGRNADAEKSGQREAVTSGAGGAAR